MEEKEYLIDDSNLICPKGPKGITLEELLDEHEYLYWFRLNADFGPAHEDVIFELNRRFEEETDKKVPKGWK